MSPVPFRNLSRAQRHIRASLASGRGYLNPWLYRRLSSVFGSVMVAHEGEEMIARSVTDPVRGTRKLVFRQHGEAYRTCCPFCSDTRHRLYVSYMYGQQDDEGRSLAFLAVCFNEDCLDDRENRWRLRDMIDDRAGALEKARVFKGRELPPTPETFDLPGDCVRLDRLPAGHPARVYVSNRGYDPDRLARVWGVSFCRQSRYRLATGRLVVPIRFDGQLAGWQARHVGELEWKGKDKKTPKYFTCPGMRRDLVVCNLDMAKAYKTLVIVEGWFDVFGFGPMAVNTLGVGMSTRQLKRVARLYRQGERSVVLLYDEDVFRKPKLRKQVGELSDNLRRMLPGRFVHVRLPEGCDPGSLDRSVSRAVVEEQADQAGVGVWWEKDTTE